MSILFSEKVEAEQESERVQAPAGTAKAERTRYDYVVIGAGSAGCVLASRLSEDQDFPATVLLLEAGGPDDDPRIHTPRRFEELQGSALDWAYQTEAEAELFNRQVPWPKGKVLGGSSSINALVYIRGNRGDYDEWAKLVGDERWSYAEVLPYFKKSENNTRAEIGAQHGKGGPMTVSDIQPPNHASELFVKAAVEKGYDETNDFNDLEQEGGAGLYQVIIADGQRDSSATAFLGAEVKARPTLTIKTKTQATRLLIENGKAFGVEYEDYSNPQAVKKKTIRADREVIVCCGTVESPKLLMLSGVGPAQHLQKLGIKVEVDLPGVGANLQDHPIAPVVYGYKPPLKSAPAAAGGVEGGLFIRTRAGLDRPDIQYHFTHKLLGAPGSPIADTAYMIVSTLVRPESRGQIGLRSKDPHDKPLIHAAYLSDAGGVDLRSLIEGVKIARQLGEAKAFDEIRGDELFPKVETQTDEQIADYIKHVAIGLYHAVGTCRMGTDPADGAVVDAELRVHGVKGLRVADASIMPTITTGNTHAATVMIAERAADLIREAAKQRRTETRTVKIENTAQAFLKLLGAMGVKHILGVPGSDVPSILDAFVKFAVDKDDPTPEPIAIPHEMCAVSMAHAYYIETGVPGVVLVHSTVGTANALCGLINASRANIPLVLVAGRTPVTEVGYPASRDLVIQWSQESFDQGGLVREFVKWDYELRTFDQLETIVRRAFALAMTDPKGPVYLVLPRELLAERHDEFTIHATGYELEDEPYKYTPVATSWPGSAAVEKVANRLAAASDPLIITRSFGRRPGAIPHLIRLAESFAIPVIEFQIAESVNFPADHRLHLGYQYLDPTSPTGEPDQVVIELLGKADIILVIDCPMPWAPNLFRPNDNAYVVHIGVDPIFSNYPVWSFPANLALAGNSVETVKQLSNALEKLKAGHEQAIEERSKRIEELHRQQRATWQEFANKAGESEHVNFIWVSHCVRELIADDPDQEHITVIQEYDLQLPFTDFNREGSYVGFSPSGGLGFGVGGALGLKLANNNKTIISVVGDGTYIFGASGAAHIVSATLDLPILWVICNNSGWGYLALETLFVHNPQKGGHGRPGEPFPMLRFPKPASAEKNKPWPAYENLIAAFGGRGQAVTDPKALPGALKDGLRFVREQKQQYLINVDCLDPFTF